MKIQCGLGIYPIYNDDDRYEFRDALLKTIKETDDPVLIEFLFNTHNWYRWFTEIYDNVSNNIYARSQFALYRKQFTVWPPDWVQELIKSNVSLNTPYTSSSDKFRS